MIKYYKLRKHRLRFLTKSRKKFIVRFKRRISLYFLWNNLANKKHLLLFTSQLSWKPVRLQIRHATPLPILKRRLIKRRLRRPPRTLYNVYITFSRRNIFFSISNLLELPIKVIWLSKFTNYKFKSKRRFKIWPDCRTLLLLYLSGLWRTYNFYIVGRQSNYTFFIRNLIQFIKRSIKRKIPIPRVFRHLSESHGQRRLKQIPRRKRRLQRRIR